MAGGYAGQVSLGHSAFFGLGAYSAALIGHALDASPWLGMLVGAVVATARRARHRLPVQSAERALLRPRHHRVLAGAPHRGQPLARLHRGVRRASPCRSVRASGPSASRARLWVYLVLCARPRHLPRRRSTSSARASAISWPAVREDEDAAQALGVPSRRLKVRGHRRHRRPHRVCGTLWAQYVGFVDPFYVFSVDLSVRFALNAIIGGHRHGHGTLPRARSSSRRSRLPCAPCSATSGRPRRHLPHHLRLPPHRGGSLHASGPGRMVRPAHPRRAPLCSSLTRSPSASAA